MKINIAEPTMENDFVCNGCDKPDTQHITKYTVTYDKVSDKPGKSKTRVTVDTICDNCNVSHVYMAYANASTELVLFMKDYIPF
jgi:hypothetical protein